MRVVGNADYFLIELFSQHLLNHVQDTSNDAFLVATVLRIFMHIFDTRKVSDSQRVFLRVVLPLVTHPLLSLFQGAVVAMVSSFATQNPNMSLLIARYLLAKWPIAIPSKEVIFLHLLFSVLPTLGQTGIDLLIPALKRVFKEVGASPNEKLATEFTVIWTKLSRETDSPIARFLIPIAAGPLNELSTSHWSPVVRQKARTALSAFHRKGQKVVQYISNAMCKEEQPPQIEKWVKVINAAYDADSTVETGLTYGKMLALFMPKPVLPHRHERIEFPAKQSSQSYLVRPVLPHAWRFDSAKSS
jgi:hypothetical protein